MQKIYTETPVIDSVKVIDSELKDVSDWYEKYYQTARTNHTTMPNVMNMSGMDAIALLENLGVKVNFTGSGTVMQQSVKPGENLKNITSVTLKLS